jgi:hypothetical protein
MALGALGSLQGGLKRLAALGGIEVQDALRRRRSAFRWFGTHLPFFPGTVVRRRSGLLIPEIGHGIAALGFDGGQFIERVSTRK